MTNDVKFYHGGLMRCCIETLKIAAMQDAIGDVKKLYCLYCGNKMVKGTEAGPKGDGDD